MPARIYTHRPKSTDVIRGYFARCLQQNQKYISKLGSPIYTSYCRSKIGNLAQRVQPHSFNACHVSNIVSTKSDTNEFRDNVGIALILRRLSKSHLISSRAAIIISNTLNLAMFLRGLLFTTATARMFLHSMAFWTPENQRHLPCRAASGWESIKQTKTGEITSSMSLFICHLKKFVCSYFMYLF